MERYWNCETSLQEEEILHSFFAQEDVPVPLLPYRDIFAAQKAHAAEHLGEDFDQRILALTEQAEPKKSKMKVVAKRVTRSYKLRPFLQAAASVAVFLCLGMAVQQASLYQAEQHTVVRTNTQQVSPSATPETAFGQIENTADSTLHKTPDANL